MTLTEFALAHHITIRWHAPHVNNWRYPKLPAAKYEISGRLCRGFGHKNYRVMRFYFGKNENVLTVEEVLMDILSHISDVGKTEEQWRFMGCSRSEAYWQMRKAERICYRTMDWLGDELYTEFLEVTS
jgi:hypothetical protein